jgi:hypothetical protein
VGVIARWSSMMFKEDPTAGAGSRAGAQGRLSPRGVAAVHAAAPQDPIGIAWLAHAKAVTGDRTGGLDRLAHWRKLEGTRYLSPYHFALAQVGPGEADEAFAALETAMVEGDPALTYLAVEPRFEPLRSDPRSLRLIDLLGL